MLLLDSAELLGYLLLPEFLNEETGGDEESLITSGDACFTFLSVPLDDSFVSFEYGVFDTD